jgi:hypothetical protein
MKKLLFAFLFFVPLVNSFSAMAIEVAWETICCKTTSSGQKFCRIVDGYSCPIGWSTEH